MSKETVVDHRFGQSEGKRDFKNQEGPAESAKNKKQKNKNKTERKQMMM
jgi:hypothetical protein